MSNRTKKFKAANSQPFKAHELFLAGFITIVLCAVFIKGVSMITFNFFEIIAAVATHILNYGLASVAANWISLTLFEKTVIIVTPVLQILFIIAAFRLGYRIVKNIGQAVLNNQIFQNIF